MADDSLSKTIPNGRFVDEEDEEVLIQIFKLLNNRKSKIKKIEPITSIPIKDDEYVKLVSHISNLWEEARNNPINCTL